MRTNCNRVAEILHLFRYLRMPTRASTHLTYELLCDTAKAFYSALAADLFLQVGVEHMDLAHLHTYPVPWADRSHGEILVPSFSDGSFHAHRETPPSSLCVLVCF
jgi:hypothetical protein